MGEEFFKVPTKGKLKRFFVDFSSEKGLFIAEGMFKLSFYVHIIAHVRMELLRQTCVIFIR